MRFGLDSAAFCQRNNWGKSIIAVVRAARVIGKKRYFFLRDTPGPHSDLGTRSINGLGCARTDPTRCGRTYQKISQNCRLPDAIGRLQTESWRPEPESNRHIRICNPLRHHSAIGPPGARLRVGEARLAEHREKGNGILMQQGFGAALGLKIWPADAF